MNSDRLVDQVLAEVVTLLGRARRLHLVVVVHQVRIPLAGVTAQEAVEALEAAPQRPPVERARARLLVARRQVVLPDHERAVTVLQEHLGQEAVLERDHAVVPGITARQLGDGGHRVAVMVAARQDARTARRAQRRRVHVAVPQAVRRERIETGRLDRAAVTAQLAEPRVIQHDEQHIRRTLAGPHRAGHAGMDSSAVRPITPGNAAPGSYSIIAIQTSPAGVAASASPYPAAPRRSPHHPARMVFAPIAFEPAPAPGHEYRDRHHHDQIDAQSDEQRTSPPSPLGVVPPMPAGMCRPCGEGVEVAWRSLHPDASQGRATTTGGAMNCQLNPMRAHARADSRLTIGRQGPQSSRCAAHSLRSECVLPSGDNRHHRCCRPQQRQGLHPAVNQVSSPGAPGTVTSTGPAGPRPDDRDDPVARIGPEDVMTAPFAGQPGHGSTAFARNQQARIADGRIQARLHRSAAPDPGSGRVY